MPVLPRLLEILEAMSDVEQKKILDSIIVRQRPPGIPGAELVKLLDEFPIPLEEVDEIAKIIEAEFSKVDHDERDERVFPD